MPACFSPLNETEGVLFVHVQPNAKKNQILGELNGVLKIRLNAPPVEGKANVALLRFLSEIFKLPRSSFHLLSGETARQKRIKIQATDKPSFQNLLRQLAKINEGI